MLVVQLVFAGYLHNMESKGSATRPPCSLLDNRPKKVFSRPGRIEDPPVIHTVGILQACLTVLYDACQANTSTLLLMHIIS